MKMPDKTCRNAILVVDDDPAVLNIFRKLLKDYPDVLYAESGTEALDLIESAGEISLALVDFDLPGVDGPEVIRRLKEAFPAVEAVIVTALNDVQAAVESIKAGAVRFITKPFDVEEILSLADGNRERSRLREELKEMRYLLRRDRGRPMVVGKSRAMGRVMELVESSAPLDVTILILGETGTGKDLLARVIHEKSPRADRPFVVTDCAVLNERLIESDLFGHRKGAFTGASEARTGKFERAGKGTIFLNEVGTLPPASQAKLLRVLEDGVLERVGGSRPIETDVRVIVATNTDLELAVKRGDFRRDLFHRLNTVTLYLPPLRERLEDIPLLAEYFLSLHGEKYGKAQCRLDEETYEVLFSYSWPGNIRELENVIERAVITAQGQRIGVDNLPPLLLQGRKEATSSEPPRGTLRVAEHEEALIRKALKKSGDNLSRAAELLGIARGTLYSKMKKYGIRPGKPG